MMSLHRATIIGAGAALLTGLALGGADAAAGAQRKQMIDEALSAAPPEIAATATVKDWEGNVMKKGTGSYTCMPTPPTIRERGLAPMCLDSAWMEWANAFMQKKQDFKPSGVGVAYMLQGDAGESNTDPFATQQTADNEWVQEGPHIMVLLPTSTDLSAMPQKPRHDGPYVMWAGTPYAHIMVPVGKKAMPETASAPQ